MALLAGKAKFTCVCVCASVRVRVCVFPSAFLAVADTHWRIRQILLNE